MKRFLILLLIASATLLSCKKNKNEGRLLTGTYKGTFQRYGPAVDGAIANVTLNFNGNKFSGESNTQYYPAICTGKFNITSSKINFESECMWPADFDWSLVLNGEYDITINGNNVEIVRSYSGVVFYQDHYKLTKQ